jgi:hypothetical protein
MKLRSYISATGTATLTQASLLHKKQKTSATIQSGLQKLTALIAFHHSHGSAHTPAKSNSAHR